MSRFHHVATLTLSVLMLAGGSQALAERAPGALHVDYPPAALEAQAGQFVLSPNSIMLERAIENGRNSGFIYYGGHLVEVGAVESTVRSLAGRSFSIPNALILPLSPGHRAEVGEILLGRWESGSGLRRAIVIGGSPEAPLVRYLDRGYEADKADEQKADTLRTDRFTALTEAWQPGTTVACAKGGQHERGVLVHLHEEQLLAVFHAGRLEPRNRAECIGLPPRADFTEGQKVLVPGPTGAFLEGTVQRVEADIGRVWVSYSFARREREMAFPVVDVAARLAP
jgi:hypothetical protein